MTFDRVPVGAEALLGDAGGSIDLLEFLIDRALAAISAEATGLLERMRADTLAFVKERWQFGVPLASFQVLQRRFNRETRSVQVSAAVLDLGNPASVCAFPLPAVFAPIDLDQQRSGDGVFAGAA